MKVKILSAILFILALLPFLFALVVHIANNAKGIGPTVWDWKINAVCFALTALLSFIGWKLWS